MFTKRTQERQSSRKTPMGSMMDKMKAAIAVKAPPEEMPMMKCGGKVKKMAKGGGIEQRGKTRGKIC